MIPNIPDAVSAYKNAGQLGQNNNTVGLADQSGQTFVDLVKTGLKTAVDAGHHSENVSAEFIAGKTDIADVVGAVRNAEALLTTVSAVRDRIVSALQELSRMPI